ncbi:hypothetical protein PIB30_089725 [Stylosanthes scabra]|uniref:Uncharacterized protein n=1 Tax=Stylosanthes scabra TaxID=79078 RepID=A0ABU6VSI8_9FABA|nr:hypothetical protein [Stylosanthes scabra]
MLGERARKRAMGLQNDGAICNRINALSTHLWNGSNDSTRNRRKNHLDIEGKNGAQRKLRANWEGSYRVVEVLGKGAYRLTTIEGAQVLRT